jgi:hypothetical protein
MFPRFRQFLISVVVALGVAGSAQAAWQYSVAVNNARLDAIESTTGTAPILQIRSGSAPANCAAARTGTVLATMTLPSDWMSAASSGSKALLGTWQDTSADATGTAGYFNILNSAGSTCHIQGNVTATGGGGELTLDSTTIGAGQTITVTTFTINTANQ